MRNQKRFWYPPQIGQLSGGAAAKVLPAKQACCAAALKFQGTEKATLTVRRAPSCLPGDRAGEGFGPSLHCRSWRRQALPMYFSS